MGLIELETQWSLDDVLSAHLALDALEEGRYRARKLARDRADRKQNRR